jgi:hypothetical protein
MNEDALRYELNFYIPGEIPSARELCRLLAAIEASLMWGYVLWMKDYHADAHRKYETEAGKGKTEDHAAYAVYRPIDEMWEGLQDNFKTFLIQKYKMVAAEATAAQHNQISIDVHNFIYSFRHSEKEPRNVPQIIIPPSVPPLTRISDEEALDGFVKKVGFSGMPRTDDIVDWVSSELGDEFLLTNRVLPSGSIEFFFDALIIASYLGLQDFPALKETIAYTLATLKTWIGKTPKRKVSTPELSPQLLRLMAHYDDVSLSIDGNRVNIRLKLAGNIEQQAPVRRQTKVRGHRRKP